MRKEGFVSEEVFFVAKEDLAGLLEDPRLKLIDVRLNWETSQTKIKHAVHEDPHDVAAWASTYDRAAPIVLYCSSPEQKTSREAARELLNQGFKNVKVLRGGWSVWHAAGLPVQNRLKAPTPEGFIGDVLKK
jgi:rhodanese-related sulfurtransferase